MPDDIRRVHATEGEVEVARLQGTINAEPVLAALRASGIPARLRGEALGSVYGLTLDGLGEVAILVPAEHAEAARGLLAAGAAGDLTLGDEDAQTPELPPRPDSDPD
ncbi:MAG: putative signal transducing protein [Acidobacteriota bacterium]